MTEIEIPDPLPEPGGDDAGSSSPYRNLLVPLLVVPAVIVMVLILVFVLFGAIAGEEATPRENLDRLLRGGANEREQAAFNLVRQALEDFESRSRDAEPIWGIDERFAPELRSALDRSLPIEDPGDVSIPLALTILLAQVGDPRGIDELCGLTRLDDGVDPQGEFRMYAAFVLGTLGPRLASAERARASRALRELLSSPDPGLRSVGAIALQTLPGPENEGALGALLDDPSLELRGNAALSLARLGSAAGADVLRQMVEPGAYESDRLSDPARWSRQVRVSESRRKALEALVELGEAPSEDELRRLAEDDPDGEIRALARRFLDG